LARLGVAYERAGALDDARRAWERALTIDPDFAGARQNLERLRRTAR
jgi:Flp pilus assembly protein TadD